MIINYVIPIISVLLVIAVLVILPFATNMFHVYTRLLLVRIKKQLTPNDQKYFDILANIYINSLKRGYVVVADDQKNDYILLQKQTELVYLNGGMPEYLNNTILDDPEIFDSMINMIQMIPSRHKVLNDMVNSL